MVSFFAGTIEIEPLSPNSATYFSLPLTKSADIFTYVVDCTVSDRRPIIDQQPYETLGEVAEANVP